MNDNSPTFPLSQYIVQGIAETVAIGTDIIQGRSTCRHHLYSLQSSYVDNVRSKAHLEIKTGYHAYCNCWRPIARPIN